MVWVVIFSLAILVFLALLLIGKLPRKSWEMTAAALMLGLAGYVWQGHADLPGAPKQPREQSHDFDEELVKQRDNFKTSFGSTQNWLILADGLSRSGKFGSAAAALRSGIRENPEDADLWLALGNALVGHAMGRITPAASYSYKKAAALAPGHPGPPFFYGLALASSGQLIEARTIWAELLKRAPEDAEWREDLQKRLEALDKILAKQ